jgi:hypothetical protein
MSTKRVAIERFRRQSPLFLWHPRVANAADLLGPKWGEAALEESTPVLSTGCQGSTPSKITGLSSKKANRRRTASPRQAFQETHAGLIVCDPWAAVSHRGKPKGNSLRRAARQLPRRLGILHRHGGVPRHQRSREHGALHEPTLQARLAGLSVGDALEGLSHP